MFGGFRRGNRHWNRRGFHGVCSVVIAGCGGRAARVWREIGFVTLRLRLVHRFHCTLPDVPIGRGCVQTSFQSSPVRAVSSLRSLKYTVGSNVSTAKIAFTTTVRWPVRQRVTTMHRRRGTGRGVRSRKIEGSGRRRGGGSGLVMRRDGRVVSNGGQGHNSGTRRSQHVYEVVSALLLSLFLCASVSCCMCEGCCRLVGSAASSPNQARRRRRRRRRRGFSAEPGNNGAVCSALFFSKYLDPDNKMSFSHPPCSLVLFAFSLQFPRARRRWAAKYVIGHRTERGEENII